MKTIAYERARAEAVEGKDASETTPAPVSEITDEMERDAARYRFLRSRNLDAISEGGVFAGMTPQNCVLNGEDLDTAVDAALTAAMGGE